MLVGVIYKGQALMPCSPVRARKMIKSRKATPFFHKGVFCISLNQDPSDNKLQSLSIGVDPGSKKEGITVVSEKHTVINIQLDAVTWVKNAVEARANARKARRSRNTSCREPRFSNRSRKGWLAPSTKARWQSKINLIKSLKQVLPITVCVVEDICAKSKKGQKRWNKSFSPLEVGKNWFYKELKLLNLSVKLKQGYETFELRKLHNLDKTSEKLSNKWEAHCVDSWVLAVSALCKAPNINKRMLLIKPMQFHRRKLHVFLPAKGGIRKRDGSTRSLGFRRGSIVFHKQYGIVTIGGFSNDGKLSVHNINTNKRLARNIKVNDITFKSFNNYCYSNG
jgi:hypothetical protein